MRDCRPYIRLVNAINAYVADGYSNTYRAGRFGRLYFDYDKHMKVEQELKDAEKAWKECQDKDMKQNTLALAQ